MRYAASQLVSAGYAYLSSFLIMISYSTDTTPNLSNFIYATVKASIYGTLSSRIKNVCSCAPGVLFIQSAGVLHLELFMDSKCLYSSFIFHYRRLWR